MSETESLPLRSQMSFVPLLPVAVAFSLGVLLDRRLNIPIGFWLGSTVCVLLVWMCVLVFHKRHLAGVILLTTFLTLGGFRHHLYWRLQSADDVSHLITDEARFVQLTGRLSTPPLIRRKSGQPLRSIFPEYDRTTCFLECSELSGRQADLAVSGRVQLQVTGHLLHAAVGDVVSVQGWLNKPLPPGNPGQFDYKTWLQDQRCRVILNVEHPDSVKIATGKQSLTWRWRCSRKIDRLRVQAERLFVTHLKPDTAAVASALLLGNRSQIPLDLQTAFLESGAIHLLAISGLHVGLLAGALFFLCRMLHLSSGTTTVLVIAFLIGYACVTSGRPSVVRATILICLLLLGRPWFRQASLLNSLALAALVILLVNPTELFHIGAQLSFLSVIAISWVSKSTQRFPTQPDPLQEPTPFSFLWAWAWESLLVMGAIWLFTWPLVAAQFHLVLPIGFLANLLLIPWIACVLWLGFVFLFCGLLLPALASAPALLFDQSLSGLLSVVRLASNWEPGHWSVAGPAAWWVTGYYLILVAILLTSLVSLLRFWRWVIVSLWMVLGLSLALIPSRPEGLRCTFIEVGHGCSILLECPNGETLLFDAGSLYNGVRAGQLIQGVLWSRRHNHIDALLISHADLDHYNATPELLKKFRVGSVLVSPQFQQSNSSAVEQFRETVRAAQTPIQIIHLGERLKLDESVSLTIFHPIADRDYPTDNEASLVLLVEYQGRRILLTGDIEHAGMSELLQQPPLDVDIVLAPHHGSLQANVLPFAEWCTPEIVIISGGDKGVLEKVKPIYPMRDQLLSTREEGAITVTLSPGGVVKVSSFREK